MAEDAVEGVLEQRERKPRRAGAEGNGDVSDVPDFNAAEDFGAAADGLAGDSTDAPAEPEDVEDTSASSNKIYFVRIPRPPINDDLVKKLSVQFTEQVTKLKAMNAKLSVKREELRELYRQKDAGYSLKGDSQPEFTEKLTRRNQLRDLRNNYQRKIGEIKKLLGGLDCKTEDELDAKVKELEERITHGSLPLREEKQLVGQISKLQAQRNQVREYSTQKSSLAELESELEKVLAVLEELDKEVDILKNEREQAEGIIKGIKHKVDACRAELKELEEEQEAAVAAKNDALAALDKARSEMNESMADYRENRSFSLKVRDLVTAGQVEEARALCGAQVDEVVGKIASDITFRKEYYKLWAAQRKYAVSELLPDSTAVVREAKPDQGKAGGKAGKGDAKARAPPPKPQGAEKARLLIEQLMAEAQAEASRKVAGRPPADDTQSSGDADDELDVPGPAPAAPAVTLPVPEAAKPKAATSARPVDLLKAVELPTIPDEEFVPPVVKSTADKAAAAAAQDKERLRAEQLKKAQEAELRKKKAAEAKEKKRKEVEAKRKVEEEERKAAEAEAAAERARKAAADRAEAEAKRKAAEAAAKAAAEAKAASTNPAHKVIAKSQVTVAAKAKPPSNDPLRYWKMLKKSTNAQLIILAIVLCIMMLALVIMAMRS